MKTPLIDIRPDHWAIVRAILHKHVPQYEVWAFGSRAKWTAKEYSDLDLAVITDKPLSLSVSAALADDFSESDLPWKVDVVDWATTSESFRKIIERDKVQVQKKRRGETMAGKWVDCTLGDVLTLQRGFDLPAQDRAPGPYPIIASTGEVGTHNEAMVKAPGVVIGRSGSLGGGQYVTHDFWPLNTTLWVKDFKGNDARFCYYLLKSIDFTKFNVGGAVPTLNRNHIHPHPVRVPSDSDEQRAIAHILGTLDDKIELNRRMNETLEAIARAIFKSWFVDFDPVRAKASGEAPESICRRLGLTPDLLTNFPDRLVDSELGEIPEGWEVTTLQAMTTKIGSGATPRGGREVYLDDGIALIRSQNVYDSSFVWEGLARISDEAAKQLASVEVRTGDVLINITGASILRTCVVDPEVLPARVNQHVAIIRAKQGVSSRYIHFQLLQADTKAYLMSLNAGGSREAVTKGHLESVPILNPGHGLLGLFQKIVAPIYSEVEQLASQSRVLMTMRDALLPKLLSGELRVPVEEDEAGVTV